MIEIPEGLSEEEFKDFYFSKTDDERVEINRQLAAYVKAHREDYPYTDEQIAEREAKIERHAKVVEDLKKIEELKHQLDRAKQLIDDRINARFEDMMGESSEFPSADKNKKSH